VRIAQEIIKCTDANLMYRAKFEVGVNHVITAGIAAVNDRRKFQYTNALPFSGSQPRQHFLSYEDSNNAAGLSSGLETMQRLS
jgi:hypothetical protein